MNAYYPIPPDVAQQAAKDYLVIIRADMRWELQREIQQSSEAHCAAGWRLHAWQDYDGYHVRQAEREAADLARLLQCPAEAVEPYIVPALIDEPTKRTIVVTAIQDVANQARREEAARSQSRRSA